MSVMAQIVFEALRSGLQVLWEYLSAHTLTCLVPAFFIAGAIGALLKKEAILKYLGPNVPRWKSYGIAAVSGSVLAVCSCTILPLFAGIHKKGAGIGPAVAFLFSGPAINILAIVLTARVLGWQLGLARAVAAVTLSLVAGLMMAALFGKAERTKVNERTASPSAPPAPVAAGAVPQTAPVLENDGGQPRPSWTIPALFVLLTAILVVGTAAIPMLYKVAAVLAMAAAAAIVAWRYLASDERSSWGSETWWLAKKILPVLLVGAFMVGLINYFLPPDAFRPYLGGNGIGAVLLAAVVGALLYMPTLLEVPIVGTTLGFSAGAMGGGPALALLLAGPAISLPSMIVLYRIVGAKKAAAYILIVILLSTLAGLIYGAVGG
jgi:hypothetical protein